MPAAISRLIRRSCSAAAPIVRLHPMATLVPRHVSPRLDHGGLISDSSKQQYDHQNDFIEGQDEPKQIKKCLYIDAQKGIQVHML